MSVSPQVRIVTGSFHRRLKNFAQATQALRNEPMWRCLYCKLNSTLSRRPESKIIVSSFLKETFKNIDDIKVFWLSSGHLFIFFQGPARAIIQKYEIFLESISMDGEKLRYHFFGELTSFQGHLDELLRDVSENAPAVELTSSSASRMEAVNIDGDLKRQRSMRYKPLLLVVEDDRVTRHFIQALMEKYCDIVVAWDAAQARKVYFESLPNLAFLDIELPDGDGRELAELFCSSDPNSFIIMVSGSLTPENTARCMKAGVKGVAPKPVKEGPLLEYIHQYNSVHQKKLIG